MHPLTAILIVLLIILFPWRLITSLFRNPTRYSSRRTERAMRRYERGHHA